MLPGMVTPSPLQPIPGLKPLYSEETYPDAQPEPLMAQLEAIFSSPVTSCLGEKADPSHKMQYFR